MAAEEETRHLVEAGPAPLGSHKPGAAGATETEARWGSSAARRRRTLDKLLIGAGEAVYWTINIAAAAHCLLRFAVLPIMCSWSATWIRAAAASARRCVWEWLPLGSSSFPQPVGEPLDILQHLRRAEERFMAAAASPPPRRCVWEWLPLGSSSFPRPDPKPIPVGEPLDVLQHLWLEEERLRSVMGSRSERLAFDQKLVMECLDFYNSKHPGNAFKPAPGMVSKYSSFYNGSCWTHGNFVARRNRSGWFSFLPGPRTLFFFELVDTNDFNGVLTCTPLDEPVTEAYMFLGFPLGWGTRRNGCSDCICKTCHSYCYVPHPFLKKTFACGHDKAESVCDMCYLTCTVLHPFPAPGEFGFGYRKYRKLSSTQPLDT